MQQSENTPAADRARRFLDAFARIENQLAEAAGDADRFQDFSQLVKQSKALTEPQRTELRAIARLRNAIVHAAYFNGEPIADPREEIVLWIERQADIIESPPTVLQVVGQQQIRAVSETDPLSDFLTLLREHKYSQAPVRLASGGIGLITTNAVARWLAEEFAVNNGVAEAATVRDVLQHAERRDRVELRGRGVSAAEAVRLLAGQEGHPPAAIVVTEHGKAQQAPLAICTTGDLPALLDALGVV